MKKLIFFTAVISIITLVGFWGGRKVCHMLMWPASVNPSKAWYFNLGLNSEQAESLKRFESGFRPNADKMCMRICDGRLQLLNLMRDPKTSPDVIYRKIEEIGTLQISLEKEIATHIMQVKKELTPEQSEAYLSRIRKELQDSIQRSGYGEVLKGAALS